MLEALARLRDWAARWILRLSVWCLAVLLATLPFWRHRVLRRRQPPDVFFEFHDVVLYTNDWLWWGALGSWLLSRRLSGVREPLHVGAVFLFGPLVGLLVLSLIGAPGAVDPKFAAYQSLRLLLLLGLYLLVVNIPLGSGVFAWSLAGATLLQAAVAIPQFLLGSSLGLRRLGELVLNPAWSGMSVVMVGEQRWLRAYGMTQHPNLLGGCLMVLLLVVGGYYMSQPGWQRLPLLFILGAGLTALLATFSRAAWLGLGIGAMTALALLVLGRRRVSLDWKAGAWLVIVVLGILVVFAAVYWPLLAPRLGVTSQGVEIRSVEERGSLVASAWALIRQRPVLGVGLGNFSVAVYRLASETVAYRVYQPVHNAALLVTAELGVLGGALWLGLLVSPWVALRIRRRQVKMTTWLASLSGALAALAIAGIVDHYVWSSHQGRLLQWVVWGLWGREWGQAVQG